MGRQAAQFAVENRDFQYAEEIARRAVAANPGDFQERHLAGPDPADRVGIYRRCRNRAPQGVDLSKSDPDRWIALVQFMVLTKQMVKRTGRPQGIN